MTYYPISVLLLAGIREILIISTPEDLGNYKRLKDGMQWGFHLNTKYKKSLRSCTGVYFRGEIYGNNSVCLILGDNIFMDSNSQNI